jgi:hypothetical protein
VHGIRGAAPGARATRFGTATPTDQHDEVVKAGDG